MTKVYGHSHNSHFIVSICRNAPRSISTSICPWYHRTNFPWAIWVSSHPSQRRRLVMHIPSAACTTCGISGSIPLSLQYISRIFMQMPKHNTAARSRPYQGMVDTIQCKAPSLRPQPHVPIDFASCATRFHHYDACTGRHLARPNPVASMSVLFVFHLQGQIREMTIITLKTDASSRCNLCSVSGCLNLIHTQFAARASSVSGTR